MDLATLVSRKANRTPSAPAPRIDANPPMLLRKMIHKLNNLMTTVRGPSEILMNRLPPEDPAHAWAEMIHQATTEVSAFLDQLLTIAGRRKARPALVLLSYELPVMCRLESQKLGGRQVLFTLGPGADKVWVKCDKSLFAEALSHLIANAAQASKPESPIRVFYSLKGGETDSKQASKNEVLIEIRDHGPGMTDSVLPRLFEPFFTTKDQSIHLGLGLAAAKGIIKQAGGSVVIENAPDGGARALITMPAFVPPVG